MKTKWILTAAAVLGVTIALIVIGLDLASPDPLAGVQAVAIEGVSGSDKLQNVPGINDPINYINYGLNIALGDRGIKIDGHSPDATLRIDVQSFNLDESGLHILANVDITKKNGEKHSMVFRLEATITPEIKINASLKRS